MGLKDEVPNSLFQNGLLLLLMCRFLGAKRPLHNIKFVCQSVSSVCSTFYFSLVNMLSFLKPKPLIRDFCIQNFYFWLNYLGNLERLACL